MDTNGRINLCEDYVSFEVAKLLKEKGMNKSCFKHYVQKNNNDGTSEAVTVCTLQMAMKWLREVHNFHITAFPAWDNDDGTKMSFEKWGESIDGFDGEYCMPISGPVYYNSYEEACEAAIKYSLENLI